MTTFYRNYVSLCASRQKSLSAVAQEIGLSRTSPNGWKKGKVPSAVTLEKLSQYFGVPVEDLTADIKKEPATDSDGLSEDTRAIIELVKNLSEEKAKLLLPMIKAAAEAD